MSFVDVVFGPVAIPFGQPMNVSRTDVGMSATPVRRRKLHTRRIVIEAFEREDGLFDLEAHLTDVKDHDLELASGVRKAGDAVHDMIVCITVNRTLDVVRATARFAEVPYPGACGNIAPAYEKLSGLNLMNGFRKQAMARLGGTNGCTHMSALAALLPTAAVQAFAGRVGADPDGKPFQLDRCHALVTSTENVRRYYPKWYVKPGKVTATQE